jgi:hypothetical protein
VMAALTILLVAAMWLSWQFAWRQLERFPLNMGH